MDGLIEKGWRSRVAGAALAAAFGLIAWTGAAGPARAFVIGFGFPYPGFYSAPWPYYPPPVYPPYYPPPAYYPPAAYYPPPAAAPTATGTAPAPAAPAAATAAITYTSRPAFTNAAGQTCREYEVAQPAGGTQSPVHGTACRDASGQWRVAN